MTKTVREMIEVMEAYERGEAIEYSHDGDMWVTTNSPVWDWVVCDYRIAVTPDTINWDHVAPEYKWMARDASGNAYLYDDKPATSDTCKDWYAVSHRSFLDAAGFASYKRGTCDWKDSLVERPSR